MRQLWKGKNSGLRLQWEEQLCSLQPVWEDTFNSPDPEDRGVDDYRQWVNDGRPGAEAVAITFAPCDKFQGSWQGWVFKKGGKGLGYYREGCLHDQPEEQRIRLTYLETLLRLL